MPLLSETDLQAFSDFAVDFLFDDTCFILRNTGTPDGNAGYKSALTDWPATTTDPIACCVVDNGGAMEQLLEANQFGKVQKMVLLPRGTDVKDNDRVKTLKNTVYYKVIAALDPGSYEVVRRATVQRFGSGVNL